MELNISAMSLFKKRKKKKSESDKCMDDYMKKISEMQDKFLNELKK